MDVRTFTIAVDYDGTLTKGIGYPLPGKIDKKAVAILKHLAGTGQARIILLTMREGKLLDDAVAACKRQGLEFWAVNENPDQAAWYPARKVYADVYVDDHNVSVPRLHNGMLDWNRIGSELESMMDSYYCSFLI